MSKAKVLTIQKNGSRQYNIIIYILYYWIIISDALKFKWQFVLQLFEVELILTYNLLGGCPYSDVLYFFIIYTVGIVFNNFTRKVTLNYRCQIHCEVKSIARSGPAVAFLEPRVFIANSQCVTLYKGIAEKKICLHLLVSCERCGGGSLFYPLF